MFHSSGKRVLVTGASSGIGEALCREFARRGAHLGLIARRGAELQALVRTFQTEFPSQQFFFCTADVSDESGLRNAMNTLFDRLGGLDIAIANAGIGQQKSAFSSHHWEITRDILMVNLLGAIHTLECAKAFLVKNHQPGKLVAISSVAATRGLPITAGYCSSKAGLTTYLESIRGELSHVGIEVIAIHPGFIRTSLSSGLGFKPWILSPEEAARRIADAIEAGKRRYILPFPMVGVSWLLKHLPDRVYDCWTRHQKTLSVERP